MVIIMIGTNENSPETKCEKRKITAFEFSQKIELVAKLTAKGVEFISKKEAIDTTTPTGKFMLTIFGAVAELEREYILQRQREGIAIAKEQGKYTGRKKAVRPNMDKVISRWRAGDISAVQAMKELKVSKTTFYRLVKG